MNVIFSSDGKVSVKGHPLLELLRLKDWLPVYLDYFDQYPVNLADIKFTMPDGRVIKVIKNDDDTWGVVGDE